MEKLFIDSALKAYAKKRPKRLHMPGHKADKEFSKYYPIAKKDVTELSFSDSLSCPDGIIKQAEQDIADILGAKRSYLLTDGSTSGIFSILYAVREFGSKIIINRNAHQSVYNACKICGIEPVPLSQNVKAGIMLPPTADQMEKYLADEKVIGLFLTYPDYYGLTFDLKKARELCDKHKKLLLLDGAHGGHIKFCNAPLYSGEYADLWVDGVHKTLPCLTQAAVLNVGNKALIPKVTNAVNIFRTSSPSYPIMSSIEYGEKFMQENGKDLLGKLRIEILALRSRLLAKGLKCFNSDDVLKLAIDFKSVGICPYKAEEYFNKKGFFCEMNDGRYLLFLLGVTTTKKVLFRLEKLCLKLIKTPSLQGTYKERRQVSMGVKKISYLSANSLSKKETVELKNSAGRILAENVGVFPPCFPLCLAGEVMTEEIIEVLLQARYTFGVVGGRVKVVKDER